MNASANFLKHADNDADEIHEMDDDEPDVVIFFASKWYRDLGNTRSTEMNIFSTWWSAQNPKGLTPEFFLQLEKVGFRRQFETIQKAILPMTRPDRVKAGKLMLEHQAHK